MYIHVHIQNTSSEDSVAEKGEQEINYIITHGIAT